MLTFFVGVFVILHGLAHIWYVVMSLNLVELKPEMGWTGISWLFTNRLGNALTHTLSAILYSASAVALVIGGVALITQAAWQRPALIIAGILSAVTLILFWDGKLTRIVEKGLIGFIISVATLVAALTL
jgi:hypothetical protein